MGAGTRRAFQRGPRDAAARPEVNNRGPASPPLRARPARLLFAGGTRSCGAGGFLRVPSGRRGRSSGSGRGAPSLLAQHTGRGRARVPSPPPPRAVCGAAGIWRGPGRYWRLSAGVRRLFSDHFYSRGPGSSRPAGPLPRAWRVCPPHPGSPRL
ncbi:unnamed protein product [Pipistrellus nathusii]|uniref:Uncharacterized protein n=1 Tax=Pipistrellus nathusii TaxID=59473 RepID=A0ABN9Z5L5_PIPNA